MKKILLPSLVVYSLFAAEENFIEIGGGFSSGKDNFSTNSEKTISAYSNAKSKTGVIPNLSFYYGEDISSSTTVYSSMEHGEIIIGSEIETSFGMFDFGFKGDFFNDAWENPFLLNSERKKTDVQEVGGYISYGMPINEQYMAAIRYEHSTIDYDKDTVIKDLKRDGTRQVLALENMIELNNTTNLFITPSFEKYKADGSASSYDIFGIELGFQKQINSKYEVAVLVEANKKEYDNLNTILNKKISSNKIGLISSLTINEPLSFEDTYLSFTAGYEKDNANHNFYDKENQFGMISVGYTF